MRIHDGTGSTEVEGELSINGSTSLSFQLSGSYQMACMAWKYDCCLHSSSKEPLLRLTISIGMEHMMQLSETAVVIAVIILCVKWYEDKV